MLKIPVWKQMPTPMLAITNGVAYVRVSEIGVMAAGQPCPVVMACHNVCGSMTEPVNMSRYAAPTWLKVRLRAWPGPLQEWKMPRHALSTCELVRMMTTAPTTRPRVTARTVTRMGLAVMRRRFQRERLSMSDFLSVRTGHEQTDGLATRRG